jgi:hypothetical protein
MFVWMLVVAPTFLAPGPDPRSISFEQIWTAPPEGKRSLHKVATVYVSSDAGQQVTAEDTIVAALRAFLPATPAADVLSANDYTSAELTTRKLTAAGYDGLVSMRLLAMDDELALRAPVTYRLLSTYWRWAAPGRGAQVKGTRGEGSVRIETNLYALADGKLVWSGLSEPMDALTARDRIEGAAHAAAAELAHAGVIPAAR